MLQRPMARHCKHGGNLFVSARRWVSRGSFTAAVVAALASSGTASSQLVRRGAQIEETAQRPSPAVNERLRRMATHLADLSDGSYVWQINRAGMPVTVRSGMTIVITGKGFDQRRTNSLVGLFASEAATTGALLKILDWSDTRISVVLPADQATLTANTDSARLSVQVVRAGGLMQSLVVHNVRFRQS